MMNLKATALAAGVVSLTLMAALLPAPQKAFGQAPASLQTAATPPADWDASKASPKDGEDHGHKRHHHKPFFAGYAVRTTADLIGVEKAELVNQLKAGHTLMQIVKEKKGWSESEYIGKLTEATSKRIDSAVQNGKIDAERAGKLKAALPAKFKEIVNRDWSKQLEQRDSKTGAPDGIFRQHEVKMQESN
ncbi:hypothetical protein AWM70_04575 [Paenibacillus yonginensis]|uniref:SH3b domain-containing protein n=1 Tax=Paenibacillus yonginensis TaxID=1462996 RepID=A0A1B1MXL8_9BACL|nr:hypothetical protein [Paenibacillus yonginensis]ANS73932.1 hypothetical protein AWM70_04575 [Paenibacillus yonginensis]